MAFTGKTTFAGGATLPEIAEDVSELVSAVSPFETPLLDVLGDPARAATSTRHEWFEDALLPNADAIDHAGLNDATKTTTAVNVANADRFRVGDLVVAGLSVEVLLVTAVNTGTGQITVSRGYGGSVREALVDGQTLRIIGNAALEGAEAPDARFTIRTRKSNFTQIFTATVQVSGSEQAVRQLAVEDELAYQKANRLRELLRDLENTVINGIAHDTAPQGSTTVRRTMRGLLHGISTNVFTPGVGDFPADTALTEEQLNLALRTVWEGSNGKVDLIVVGGKVKRQINAFVPTTQRFAPVGQERFKQMVSVYESDFGVCQVVLSRHVPADAVLLLDSSRISVLPLSGRSFHYRPLAVTGDYSSGELVGEYTTELRNESAHGVIRGLAV